MKYIQLFLFVLLSTFSLSASNGSVNANTDSSTAKNMKFGASIVATGLLGVGTCALSAFTVTTMYSYVTTSEISKLGMGLLGFLAAALCARGTQISWGAVKHYHSEKNQLKPQIDEPAQEGTSQPSDSEKHAEINLS